MNRESIDPTNPVELLQSLDIPAIRARLEEIERESRALRVLLRSAVVRQREQGARCHEVPVEPLHRPARDD
jgi:hypothetical protein